MPLITKFCTMCILLTGIASLIPSAQAADIDQLVQECNECHGDNGVSQEPQIPTIAGIPEFNLYDMLLSYKEGRKARTVHYVKGDTSRQGNMTEAVKPLTEQEIEALAAHYASLPFVPAKQPVDAELAAKGAEIHESQCEKCHSEGGSAAIDEASILAGQWKPYLREAMQYYIDGDREGEKNMVERLKALSGAELDALAEYYASQQ